MLKVVKLSDTRVTVGHPRPRAAPPRRLLAGEAVPDGRRAPRRGDRRAIARGRRPGDGGARHVPSSVIALSPDIPDETAQILDQNKEPSRLADIAAATSISRPTSAWRCSASSTWPSACAAARAAAAPVRAVQGQGEDRHAGARGVLASHQREAVLRQKLKAIQDELGEGDDGEDSRSSTRRSRPPGCPRRRRRSRASSSTGCSQMPPSSAEYTVHAHLPRVAGRAAVVQADHRHARPRRRRAPSSTPTTTTCRRSRSASSSTWPCASWRRTRRGRSSASSARPASARPRSASRSRARSAREFVRISLGGVRDEAEIRGHRRTYIGALPGRIIQGMRARARTTRSSCSTRSTSSARTSAAIPAAALLEVLDPEQNNSFSRSLPRGHVRPLGRHLHRDGERRSTPIPPALRDRMEVLELPGYTREEKHADRDAVPGAEADRRARADDRPRDRPRRRGARRDHRALHARGGRAQPRARDRQRHPRHRGQGRVERDVLRPQARRRRDRRVPRAGRSIFSEIAERTEHAGRGHGAGLDADGRRHPVHRGHADGRARGS